MPPIGLYREGLVLSWACDDRQRPLGAAWREPHRGTWWEWGLPCESGTHRPVCLWEGPRSSGLRDGSLGPRRVLSAGTGQYRYPQRATAPSPQEASKGPCLPDPQPKASGLQDRSGGGWARTF